MDYSFSMSRKFNDKKEPRGVPEIIFGFEISVVLDDVLVVLRKQSATNK
jgi:hypothetical protein